MKLIKIFVCLFWGFCFAQKQPIELKIDSITYLDSVTIERKFTINYHIKNLTNDTISFFLDGIYKRNNKVFVNHNFQLYQNKLFLNVNSILSISQKEELANKEFLYKLINDKKNSK